GTGEDGRPLPQMISRGPVAATIPIKHLGTNGGGFFGANSAHPFENPSAWTNFLTCVNILLFPMSLVMMFRRMIGHIRHAGVIYGVMMALFLVMIGWAIYWDTLQPNPGLTRHDERTDVVQAVDAQGNPVERPLDTAAVAGLPVDQELGNLEGKELR